MPKKYTPYQNQNEIYKRIRKKKKNTSKMHNKRIRKDRNKINTNRIHGGNEIETLVETNKKVSSQISFDIDLNDIFDGNYSAEKFIEKNNPELIKVKLEKNDGNKRDRLTGYGDNSNEDIYYYLPYISNHITVIKLPINQDQSFTVVTDVMNGCNLLLKKTDKFHFIFHDNLTMNQRERNNSEESCDEEKYMISESEMNKIEKKMNDVETPLSMAIVSKAIDLKEKNFDFCLQTRETIGIRPCVSYSSKTNEWKLVCSYC